MRLMIRWSPISSVFSIDPEGITRACPSVPLTSKNTRTTQNHAIISCFTRVPSGYFASGAPFFFTDLLALVFTFHHYFLFELRCAVFFSHFQLHQVRRVYARIARRAELSILVSHRLPQPRQGQITQRIRSQIPANLFRRV